MITCAQTRDRVMVAPSERGRQLAVADRQLGTQIREKFYGMYCEQANCAEIKTTLT